MNVGCASSCNYTDDSLDNKQDGNPKDDEFYAERREKMTSNHPKKDEEESNHDE